MARTLLLHIGPHKTGTSALQKAWTELRPQLASAGWTYPDVGFSQNAHHNLVPALRADDGAPLAALAAQLAAGDGNVVMSSERFSLVRPEGWERLRDSLGGAFELRFAYVLRNPLDLLASRWQETVKHGSSEALPEYLLNQTSAPFSSHVLNPDLALAPIARIFGDAAIAIFSYEAALAAEGGLIGVAFREMLGIPLPALPRRFADVNKSFTPVKAELIRILGVHGVPAVQLMLRNAELRAIAEEVAARSAPFRRSISLDLDGFVLSAVERRTAERWAANFRFPTDGKRIHAVRRRDYAFIDAAFWTRELDLAARLARFAAAQAEAALPLASAG